MKNEKTAIAFKNAMYKAGKVLLPVAAALCFALFGVTFIYAVVLAAAWGSAMAFFLAAAIAFIAAGLGIFATTAAHRLINGIRKDETKPRDECSEAAPAAPTDKKEKVARFMLKNGGYIPLLIAVVCVVALAAMGGIDSENWVNERAEYCASVGYLAETDTRITAFQRDYYVLDDVNTPEDESEHVVITKISIDAAGRTAVIRYADTEGDVVTVETRILYENEYTTTVSDGNTLTVTHNPAPALTRPIDKMLAPMFEPSAAELQFVVTIPTAYKDGIAIEVVAGDLVYAQE